jgi:hypothetical protein
MCCNQGCTVSLSVNFTCESVHEHFHVCILFCAVQIRSLDAATNVGPDQLLDLHNEMCYNPKPNKKIILICLTPAKEVRCGLKCLRLLPGGMTCVTTLNPTKKSILIHT